MTDTKNIRTAVVIGGGVIGQACALSLQRSGIRTILLAPDSSGREPSWGNAGHIAVEQTAPMASLETVRSLPSRLFVRGGAAAFPLRDVAAWAPFGLQLLLASRPAVYRRGAAALRAALGEAMPAWRRMTEAIGAPDLLNERGHYMVWESERTARARRQAWLNAETGTATVHDVTADELAALSALTTKRAAGAIRFDGSGQIADLPALATAMAAALQQGGGERRPVAAQSLIIENNRSSVRLQNGEILSADAVVVASGVASGELLRPLGHKVPIIAERGYHIQSPETDWPADMPPVVFEDRSMIVTRFRSGLRAASFVEFGRVNSPPDPRKWARLRSHVAELGLSFAAPVREWAGARPTLPDYLPAIGASERAGNLFYAFGHQHLGLTLAGVTGEAIASLVTRTAPAIDVTPFNLARFDRRGK